MLQNGSHEKLQKSTHRHCKLLRENTVKARCNVWFYDIWKLFLSTKKTALLQIPPRNSEVNCLGSRVSPWGPLEEGDPPGNVREGLSGTSLYNLQMPSWQGYAPNIISYGILTSTLVTVYQHYEKIDNMTMKKKSVVESRGIKAW